MESSAKYRLWECRKDFERGYQSSISGVALAFLSSCHLHPHPCLRLILFLLESSLSLVSSTLSSLAIPPPPLPSPVRSAHEYPALPGERLARRGTSGVRLLRAAAPAEPLTVALGPLRLHVNAFVWRNPGVVELG